MKYWFLSGAPDSTSAEWILYRKIIVILHLAITGHVRPQAFHTLLTPKLLKIKHFRSNKTFYK